MDNVKLARELLALAETLAEDWDQHFPRIDKVLPVDSLVRYVAFTEALAHKTTTTLNMLGPFVQDFPDISRKIEDALAGQSEVHLLASQLKPILDDLKKKLDAKKKSKREKAEQLSLPIS